MDTVFLRSVSSYQESSKLEKAMEDILSASEAAQGLTPNSKVLLKPNLLAKHEPTAAVTTNPEVVRAVIRVLKRRGITHITLADSSGGPYASSLMKALYRTSGLEAVCKEEQVTLHLGTESTVKLSGGQLVQEFALINPVVENDFIINLPKMKTHMMTVMSCSVKNLFGCVPGLMKAEFHARFPDKEHFGQMLVDLAQMIAPQLTIVDAIVSMEGDGPAGGTPRETGILLGGENIYAIDHIVCRLMGLTVEKVPYLAEAIKRNISPVTAEEISVDDPDGCCHPIKDFKLPSSFTSINFQDSAPSGLRWATPFVINLVAPKPKINKRKCTGCGNCAEICPAHVITIENKKANIAPQKCIKCFCCHEICPVKAIDVKRISLFNL